MSLADLAPELAPVVLLDAHESLWPVDPQVFLRDCDLCWRNRSGKVVESRPADASELGAGNPYVFEHHLTTDFTRPRDTSGRRDPNVPLDAGFFLRPQDPDTATTGDQDVLDDVPAFFEVSERLRAITYWFFFGGSALPWAAARVLRRGVLEEELDEAEAERALAEARRAYPELYADAMEELDAEAVRAIETAPAAELKALPFFRDPLRRLRKWIEKALDAAINAPLMHDCDWERIQIFVGEDGRTPDHVEFFQHQGPGESAMGQRDPDGRLQVYSARGSHASFPKPQRGLDYADGAGLRWRTWQNLENVRDQAWYGFGGAWGRVGHSVEGTGPLGPCRWK